MATKSNLWTLNLKDAFKGFITAVVMSFVTTIYQFFQSMNVQWTWAFWQPVVYTAIGAGLAYLIKNFLTNSNDQFAKAELPK